MAPQTQPIVAIVQMRMGSSRLPGKMLMPLGPATVAELVLGRLGRCRSIHRLVAATTDQPEDDALAQTCRRMGVEVFRGASQDVLDRFYRCALAHQAQVVVRLTGDCPFHDPRVVDAVVAAYLEDGGVHAYVNNVIPPTYPDGLDVEVFPFAALERAWRQARLASEREHVTPFIWKDPARFPQKVVRHPRDLSGLRWTLDTAPDLDFLRAVLAAMPRPPLEFGLEDVLAVLERRPELMAINAGQTRNQGYAKSLAEDGLV